MIIENQRLKKNYNIALQVVTDIIGKERVAEKMRKVVKVDISPRAVRRYGICKTRGDECIIEVSWHLFEVEDKEMICTLIHEILHTFRDAKNHGAVWQWYAKQITDNSEYTITRTRTIDGIDRENIYKYKITCQGCGNVSYKARMSSTSKYYYKNNGYRCRHCKGTKFNVLDMKTDKEI